MHRRHFLKTLALTPFVGHLPIFASPSNYDVVIVGAGLAGLAAAKQCHAYGMNAIVLEATDRVGGRIKSLAEIDGCPEVGGMQIGKGYGLMRFNANQYDLTLSPPTQFARGQTLSVSGKLLDGKAWPTASMNKLASHEKKLSPARLLSFYLNQATPFDASEWLAPDYRHLDIPLYEYLTKNGASSEALRLIEHNFNGLNLKQFSTLESLKSLNARKVGQPGFDMIEGGNEKLPQAMAAQLNAKVLVNHPVVSVTEKNKLLTIRCANGQQLIAKHLVFAAPFSALRDIALNVPLSSEKRFAIEHLSYTPITQVLLQVNEAFWQEQSLSPNLWSDTPIERIFAMKNKQGRVSTLLCWINGENALKLDQLSEKEIGQYVVHELARIRPESRGKVAYIQHQSWQANRYQKGAYAYYPAGLVRKIAPHVSGSQGRVHFAGEHTQPLLPGMEAALTSGMRVADEIYQSV